MCFPSSSSVIIGEVQAVARGAETGLTVRGQRTLRWIRRRLWCGHARARHRAGVRAVDPPGESMRNGGRMEKGAPPCRAALTGKGRGEARSVGEQCDATIPEACAPPSRAGSEQMREEERVTLGGEGGGGWEEEEEGEEQCPLPFHRLLQTGSDYSLPGAAARWCSPAFSAVRSASSAHRGPTPDTGDRHRLHLLHPRLLFIFRGILTSASTL